MTKRVVLEVIPLVLLVAIPLSVHAGVLATFFGAFEKSKVEASSDEVATEEVIRSVPLLKAAVNSDPRPATGGGDIIVDGDALVPQPVSEEKIKEEGISAGQISIYTVQSGDTPSQIAAMYDISLNTLLWANDIQDPDLIQPDTELLILPITGVQHVVKEGDTIRSIAKKYGDEENLDEIVTEIVEYNKLASVDEISVGDTVVVPGGEAPSQKQKQRTYATPTKTSGGSAVASSGGGSGLINPVPGAVRSQGIHGYNGVDLAAGYGTPIRAAAAGTVIVSKGSGWNGGYGLYVVVKHANGTQTLYAHNSANLVGVGETVSAGQAIARVGSTGRSTGNHVHFEVRGARNPF